MTAGWRSPLGGPRSDQRPTDPKPEPDWEAVRRRDRGRQATLDEADVVAGGSVVASQEE